MWGAPLARQIREGPPELVRRADVKKPETSSGFWNWWALGEWNKQHAAGQKPSAMALKKQFNAIKYTHPQWLDSNGQPWLKTIHRDAHAQPFAH